MFSIELFILICIGICFNALLRHRFYRAHIDWDTSYHLYKAKMMALGINVKASYKLGIKIFPIILYYLTFPLWKKKHYRFRLLTLIFTSISIILIAVYVQEVTVFSSFVLLSYVFITNAILFYPQTSATEFYSIPFLLCGLLLNEMKYIPLLLNATLTKVTDILYIFHLFDEPVNYILYGLGAVSIAFMFLIKKWTLEPKTIFFIKSNKRYITIQIITLIVVMIYGDPIIKLFIISSIMTMFVQRKITYFYWIPTLTFLSLAFTNTHFEWLIFFTSGLLLLHLIVTEFKTSFKIKGVNNVDLYFRERYMRDFGHRNLMQNNTNASAKIRELVRNDEKVYLWGTNVQLLLQANLIHCEKTFYNHHHLVKWSKIIDYYEYIHTVLNTSSPKFVLYSIPAKEIPLPNNWLEQRGYNPIVSLPHFKLFRKI